MLPLIDLIHATREVIDYPLTAARVPVSGITTDSRQAESGTLFVALKGQQSNGADFVTQARHNGASCVLCDSDASIDEHDIIVLRTRNPRLVMAQMAARLHPGQPQHLVAVTGTDGKTSTADFYRQFWYQMNQLSASIGTLGVISGEGEAIFAGSYTTMYPVQLHQCLSELHQRGVEYACMEASSHGLDQYRMDGVKLEAAAFTNIARDHLDYHGTEDAYFHAKLRLFDELLPPGGLAVVNQDDARFESIKAICEKRKHRIIGFGKRGDQFRIVSIITSPSGQEMDLEVFGTRYRIEVPLVGAFQAMNILAALGLVVGTGGDLEQALAVIPRFLGVSGRLQQVARLDNGATVFIDYAHTPMALANILNTLRPHTRQRLHVVFGCGGDRDRGKRPEMGRIADTLADVAIVTDDNPRSENPTSIRRAILDAMKDAKEIADRKEAIYAAIKGLAPGDIIVIAGKGHEKTQIIGDQAHPFDDAQIARDAATELQLAA